MNARSKLKSSTTVQAPPAEPAQSRHWVVHQITYAMGATTMVGQIIVGLGDGGLDTEDKFNQVREIVLAQHPEVVRAVPVNYWRLA